MDNFVLQNAGQQHEPRLKHTCGLSNPLKSAFNAWCVTDTVIHMWFHEKNCKTLKVGFFRQIAMFILILLSNKSNFTEKIFKLYKLDFSHFSVKTFWLRCEIITKIAIWREKCEKSNFSNQMIYPWNDFGYLFKPD